MSLSGKRVALLIEDEYQILEGWYPKLRLQEAGAEVRVIGSGTKSSYDSKEHYPMEADASAAEVSADDFDAVVIPGGFAPDNMRLHPEMTDLVRKAYESGKLVAAICHGGWILASAGAATPTEIFNAYESGASAVKVFPASQLGGPQYLRAVRAPLPQVPLVPAGGIGVKDVGAYLSAGAAAVGLGGPLLGDALDEDGELVLTGITPALSPGARETVHKAVDLARAAGVKVSLDVNYRAALWSPDEARPVLREPARRCDILFAGDDEAELLGVTGDPEDQARGLAGLGPSEVVIKLGARGAVGSIDGEHCPVAPLPVTAVDAVGAGDAFVAGYLAERMSGRSPDERLRTAAACGAFAVCAPGDWEGFPTRQDLGLLAMNAGSVLR